MWAAANLGDEEKNMKLLKLMGVKEPEKQLKSVGGILFGFFDGIGM